MRIPNKRHYCSDRLCLKRHGLLDENKYTFLVRPDANKTQIKDRCRLGIQGEGHWCEHPATAPESEFGRRPDSASAPIRSGQSSR